MTVKELIEELETFAYTVAHDIQHTLGLSIGFADGLLHHFDAMPDDELKEHLHRIVRNNQKMSNIIDELLLLTGVRKQDVTTKPLNMALIVAEAQRQPRDQQAVDDTHRVGTRIQHAARRPRVPAADGDTGGPVGPLAQLVEKKQQNHGGHGNEGIGMQRPHQQQHD